MPRTIHNAAHNCNQCDFASSPANALRTHLKTPSGEKSNKCNQCDFACSDTSCLWRHLKTHNGEKPNKCSQCEFPPSQAGNWGWDLGYTLVHDVSTSLENVHWHPPSQHQLQRALRLGQWYPMKILLHSCKYSAGENRTICWRCNCNCQLKGRHPQLQYSFFSALKNSPPKINWTFTK